MRYTHWTTDRSRCRFRSDVLKLAIAEVAAEPVRIDSSYKQIDVAIDIEVACGCADGEMAISFQLAQAYRATGQVTKGGAALARQRELLRAREGGSIRTN